MRQAILSLFTVLFLFGCGPTVLEGASSPDSASLKATSGASVGPVSVSLNSGWNGIGFQAASLTALNSNASVAGMAYYDNGAYQIGSFTQSDINAGEGTRRGFWVFATAATSFSYSGSDAGAVSLNLRSGWNLVAFPGSASIPGSALTCRRGGQTVPLGSVLLSSFYQIGPSGNTVVDVLAGGSCQPGRAYWVYALDVVTLGYGSGTPSPTPAASPSPTPTPSPSPGQGFFSLTNTTVVPPTEPIHTESGGGWNVTYQAGLVTYTPWHTIGGNPGSMTMRFEWSTPPAQIRPGEVWPITGKATVVSNVNPLGWGGTTDGRAPGGSAIFPLTSNGGSAISVDNSMPAGTVVSRAATSKCPAGGADFDLHMSAPNGNKSWSADYYYHYHWNP